MELVRNDSFHFPFSATATKWLQKATFLLKYELTYLIHAIIVICHLVQMKSSLIFVTNTVIPSCYREVTRNVLKYIGTEWGEGHHFEVHFSKKENIAGKQNS